MRKTNTQIMEDELSRLRGSMYNPPLTNEEIADSLRFLCSNPVPAQEIEDFLKDKGLI